MGLQSVLGQYNLPVDHINILIRSAIFFAGRLNLSPWVHRVFDQPTQNAKAVMKIDDSELVEHLRK